MKKTLLIITSLVFITSAVFPQSKMDIDNLIDMDGLLYKPNDDKPYTGKVFDLYDNAQKNFDGRYRNGLSNGKWTWWSEGGKMGSSGTYKNGIKNGEWTRWYENGQKKSEVTYKDGKENGLYTYWYENGQKRYEGPYKVDKNDGESISSKCWDEGGNECECNENEFEWIQEDCGKHVVCLVYYLDQCNFKPPRDNAPCLQPGYPQPGRGRQPLRGGRTLAETPDPPPQSAGTRETKYERGACAEIPSVKMCV